MQQLLQGVAALQQSGVMDTVKGQIDLGKIDLSKLDLQALLQQVGGLNVQVASNDTVKKKSGVKFVKSAVPVKIDSINGRPAHWAKTALNQKAPELQVEAWITEEPNTKGKFQIWHKWSTLCGPCIKSIPHLNELAEEFNKDLVIIGLGDNDSKKVDKGIKYYRARDTKTFTPLECHVLSWVLLIDPDGIVRWEGLSYQLEADTVREIIKKYK